ncbi:chromosomal replication initiator protein DnaA [Roseibium polysiphoniae]|uniref:chromosomal replication initiator protein DnaA n=1 Tax=Roseibium polysiphoniae TaxID=2571221 RepID=UPI0032978DD7
MQIQSVNGTERWDRVKSKLREELGDDAYFNWFGRVILEENDGDVVRLSVPTRFLKHWIQSHYEEQLVGLWQHECRDINSIELTVRSALRPSKAKPKKLIPTNASPARAGYAHPGLPDAIRYPQVPIALGDADEETLIEFLKGAPTNPRNSFESFVEGDSNGLAFEAARKIAGGQNEALDLLYLHGAVGFGKTHLLHAVATEARSRGQNVCYLTAEYFMYHLVPALKSRSFQALKRILASIDVLLVDDMQFLHGKQAQADFSETLLSLMQPVKHVIVAADRPPRQLETVECGLRDRLCDGLVVGLQPPDFALRRGILTRRLAAAKKLLPTFDIPQEVLDYVACHVTACGRDLEGAINRLYAHHQLTSQAITPYLADKILSDLVRSGEKRNIKIEEIQQVVCKHYSVSKADLLSACRSRNLVRPRQIAMYLSKVLTPRSLPEIGKRFGGRDHTTVLHAVRKIEAQSQADTSLGQELALLKRLAHS